MKSVGLNWISALAFQEKQVSRTMNFLKAETAHFIYFRKLQVKPSVIQITSEDICVLHRQIKLFQG